MTEMTDRIRCRDCDSIFLFTASEQELFAERGWPPPIRCRECRALAKQRREEMDTRAVRFDDFSHRADKEKGR